MWQFYICTYASEVSDMEGFARICQGPGNGSRNSLRGPNSPLPARPVSIEIERRGASVKGGSRVGFWGIVLGLWASVLESEARFRAFQ